MPFYGETLIDYNKSSFHNRSLSSQTSFPHPNHIKKYLRHRRAFFCILSKASLTVECAFILPLFLMAMVTLIVFMDTIGIQAQKNLELSNKARTAAMYESVLSGNDSASWIDLARTTDYTFPYSVFKVPKLKILSRARVYPWVGKNDSSGLSDVSTDTNSRMVFITDNKSVYHTHSDCTHIDLSVSSTTLENVKTLKNEYGQKYRPCDGFPSNYTGTVYYTAKGEYYYPSSDYGSITRTPKLVSEDSVSDLHECERCAARDS